MKKRVRERRRCKRSWESQVKSTMASTTLLCDARNKHIVKLTKALFWKRHVLKAHGDDLWISRISKCIWNKKKPRCEKIRANKKNLSDLSNQSKIHSLAKRCCCAGSLGKNLLLSHLGWSYLCFAGKFEKRPFCCTTTSVNAACWTDGDCEKTFASPYSEKLLYCTSVSISALWFSR